MIPTRPSPVTQDANGTWYFSTYGDVKLFLTDNRFSRHPPSDRGHIHQEKAQSLFYDVINRWALFNDPPEHTRLRAMMAELFNPRFIKETKSLIELTVDELLHDLLQNKNADFMRQFAYPLPSLVINALLGADLDLETIQNWSQAMAAVLDQGSPAGFHAITPEIVAMQAYFEALFEAKEKAPGTDWLSQMIKMREAGVSQEDLLSTCIFLLLAGQETVKLSLGLGLITLLKNPEQLALLQKEPELMSGAVEEMLRYESPAVKISRWTREDIVVGEVKIPKDQLCVALVDLANRDPAKFIEPNRFDIMRENNRHLAFGQGIHQCVGALLARFELQIAFGKLLPHIHRFAIFEDGIKFASNTAFKYITGLPVAIA